MTKTIVITGSTKGIGYGLAEEFLKRGHNVVVSGRNQERLDKAVASLSADHNNVAGCFCDVTILEDNEKLFAFAKEKFGRVDIWINNAGVAHAMTNVWELPIDVIQDSVNANVYGSIYGSRVAIQGMLEQEGGGWIYNLEGFGSSGRTMAGYVHARNGKHYSVVLMIESGQVSYSIGNEVQDALLQWIYSL